MLLKELKEEVFKLSPTDRLALASIIMESLEDTLTSKSSPQKGSRRDRSDAIKRMGGLLKTDRPAPTDKEVAAILNNK